MAHKNLRCVGGQISCKVLTEALYSCAQHCKNAVPCVNKALIRAEIHTHVASRTCVQYQLMLTVLMLTVLPSVNIVRCSACKRELQEARRKRM